MAIKQSVLLKAAAGADVVQLAQQRFNASKGAAREKAWAEYQSAVQARNKVVDHVDRIVKVLPGRNAEDTRKLLLGTASTETNYGKAPGAGSNIFQIDPAAANEVLKTKEGPKLQELKDKVHKATGTNLNDYTPEQIRADPWLNTVAARLYYARSPQPIPATREGRAQLWKDTYNTSAGKGTADAYLKRSNPQMSMVTVPPPAPVQPAAAPAITKVAAEVKEYDDWLPEPDKCDTCDSTEVQLMNRSGAKGWHCLECGASTLCHPGSTRPMGTMADIATRMARSDGHYDFDPLWKDKHMDRDSAYSWLADQMGKPKSDTHFGKFDMTEARMAGDLARDKLMELRGRQELAMQKAASSGLDGNDLKTHRPLLY